MTRQENKSENYLKLQWQHKRTKRKWFQRTAMARQENKLFFITSLLTTPQHLSICHSSTCIY
jgi:hypothetical protein